ncbi:hypothetical protein ACFO4E_07235 [Nocardiopsis mangrovi]|uniref:Uncharacterized protein n=1 Tax=Nocardiopsis mangrovi TaxID=1179818 RepID=A0ABV9DUK1_9ACTN
MSSPLPAPLKKARVCLYITAGVAVAMLAAGLLVGLDARGMGGLTGQLLPALLALPCALRLPKGRRPLFWTITVLQVWGMLGALAALGAGDPRGLTQLVLPVLVLVFITRPAARAHVKR